MLKLVGPVMMTVDLNESKANVEKRLQLIEGELKKIDTTITAKQAEQRALGDEIAKLQTSMASEAAKAAKAIAGMA